MISKCLAIATASAWQMFSKCYGNRLASAWQMLWQTGWQNFGKRFGKTLAVTVTVITIGKTADQGKMALPSNLGTVGGRAWT